MMKAKGAIFHEVPASERQKWIDASPDFLDETIKKMEKQGKGDEARYFVKRWLEIVDKY